MNAIEVVPPSAFQAAARSLMRFIDLENLTYQWRHHGLGMLQAEMTNDLRLHVWHPKLVTIPENNFRNVHDHRFHITSYVAAGSIADIPYKVFPKREYVNEDVWYKDWPIADMHEIVHAKQQMVSVDKKLTKPIGKAYVFESPPVRHLQGDVYTIPRRSFHTTRVTGVAVTLIHRHDFDTDCARILGPADDVGSAIVKDDGLDALILRNFVLREANEVLMDTR